MLYARWLAFIGDHAYDLVIRLNTVFNWIRHRIGMRYWSLSSYLKNKVKNAVQYISDYEETVAREAARRDVDGVICGHIHHAEIKDIDGIHYMNDGDWVESCTALVEHLDGRFELVYWADVVAARGGVSADKKGRRIRPVKVKAPA